jgi:prepilin-type N-terminal cleavage/methylation domain-containing protein
MSKAKGFTLVELMVVILIVSILAAVAIPILRGRIDAAKWSEGKSMMGTIATAIRAYCAEKGPNGSLPTAITGTGATSLNFLTTDLDGTYFGNGDFTMSVTGMSPPVFTVTCTPTGNNKPSTPTTVTLSQAGVWTES